MHRALFATRGAPTPRALAATRGAPPPRALAATLGVLGPRALAATLGVLGPGVLAATLGALGPGVLAATLALSAAGCGAPPAETNAPPPPAPAPPPTPSAPKAPDPCDDGSCFRCGEGFCPLGFYCERPPSTDREACAWAPRCARSPSCSCLAPYLGGCRCEERSGAAYVSCD